MAPTDVNLELRVKVLEDRLRALAEIVANLAETMGDHDTLDKLDEFDEFDEIEQEGK